MRNWLLWKVAKINWTELKQWNRHCRNTNILSLFNQQFQSVPFQPQSIKACTYLHEQIALCHRPFHWVYYCYVLRNFKLFCYLHRWVTGLCQRHRSCCPEPRRKIQNDPLCFYTEGPNFPQCTQYILLLFTWRGAHSQIFVCLVNGDRNCNP